MKVIDFHTHVFDDAIAKRAIDKLKHAANVINYRDGTASQLIDSNATDLIDLSIVLPIATKVMQGSHINAKNVKENSKIADTRLMYFGAIHPDDSSINIKLSELKGAGFKGIKLHPAYQNAYIDDPEYLQIIDTASALGLITVIHAGEDIGCPGYEGASVKYLLNMIDTLHPQNVVLAHMGGWNQWDLVESDLAGANVYFDTSFCLNDLVVLDDKLPNMKNVRLEPEQFDRIVKSHGVDKILFGTDSPWSDRRKSIQLIEEIGFDEDTLTKIFSKNAEKLLNL